MHGIIRASLVLPSVAALRPRACQCLQQKMLGAFSPPASRSFATKRESRSKKKQQEDEEAKSDTDEATSANSELAAKLTPVLEQFFHFKAQYPDNILFFRMGDFYEMLFDDAKITARLLDIQLTARGKFNGEPIPMCGVPVHAMESYAQKLVKQGQPVVVVDQTESPEAARREKRKVVSRGVSRLITPGTLTEDRYLDAKENNFLLSISSFATTETMNSITPEQHTLGLSWIDISTGAFHTAQVPLSNIQIELLKLRPSEVLLSPSLANHYIMRKVLADYHITKRPESQFQSEKGKTLLKQHFSSASTNVEQFSLVELAATGALLDYVLETQMGKMPHCDQPSRIDSKKTMYIDSSTRKSLEIDRTLLGERKGSLLDVMDKTVTGAGSRLLQSFLRSPLTDFVEITARHDAVEFFFNDFKKIEELQQALENTADVERCLQRISLQRGGPRDLECIASTLLLASENFSRIVSAPNVPQLLKYEIAALQVPEMLKLMKRIKKMIRDAPLPVTASEGGFIRPGFNEEIDRLNTLRVDRDSMLEKVEIKYRELTGVSTLKIRQVSSGNSGIFVEIPRTQQEKLSKHAVFRQSHTMTNNVRYQTDELNELLVEINEAEDEVVALEHEFFSGICEEVSEQAATIARAAKAIAMLDVFSALALIARTNQYVRPVLLEAETSEEKPAVFNVKNGRHPIVEALRMAQTQQTGQPNLFTANDCHLDTSSKHLWLITGPNMSGKSVFLRQNALLILMAQIGSFVPASHAQFSIVSSLFSRVGASDNLANDQSTFMVEMMETANILHRATRHSFVIVDEIGRGTANIDGLSIAWAVLEHLHNVTRCRTLFSTHYHELVMEHHLDQQLKGLACYRLNVSQSKQGDIVFTHRIVPGHADHSYGIHVAELAGVPHSVTARATEILKRLSAPNGQDSNKHE